jgi:CDGSH-type Zn-finger protein
MATEEANDKNSKRISVSPDGPYEISGGIPLVRKTQVVTDHGEPVAWKKVETFHPGETYLLCRCGQSKDKPFCDGSHGEVFFDGSETADTKLSSERRVRLPGGKTIVIKRDYTVCMESGFCGNRFTNLEKMAAQTDDPGVLAQAIAMIEHCPSGSYTYSFVGEEVDIEPDLPEQIAVTTEMTDEGPVIGALWVTGNIPIERSDGKPLETRNRVTLCRCGESKIKPLCDGQHRLKKLRE